MTAELVAESRRIARDLSHLVSRASLPTEFEMEAPIRLHSRDVDDGGLGAPAFHPAFLRYIDQGSCTCGRPAQCAPGCHWERDHVLGHLAECQPACAASTHFRPSIHRNHPNRLKRAMRKLRQFNPKAYDLAYLIVVLGLSFEQATARLNADELRRGREVRPPRDYAVLWVSAGSMLASIF